MKKVGWYIILIGAIFTIMTFRQTVAVNRTPVDLYDVDTNVSEIGYFDLIDTYVYAVLDTYATSFKTSSGNITSKSNCYIIPAFNGDETYYIGIKVSDNSCNIYDEILEDTYDYLMGYSMDLSDKTVHARGFMKNMNQKTQELYYDWFRETEWFETEEELQKYALPIYIETYHDTRFFKYEAWYGIGFIVIGICILLAVYHTENKKIVTNLGAIEINGKIYAKSSMQNIHNYVLSGQLEYAAQDLSILTGLSQEEAQDVVNHWSNYYI